MFNDIQEKRLNKLKPKHQLAVDLRLNGYSYQEIASRVNSKEQTVGTWFMRGGICQEAYEYKNRLLAEDRWVKMRQIEAGILDLASDALRVMKESIAGGNLKATIKVLEMVVSKSIHKEEVQPQESEGILLLREMITAHRETARLDRLSNNTSGDHPPIT